MVSHLINNQRIQIKTTRRHHHSLPLDWQKLLSQITQSIGEEVDDIILIPSVECNRIQALWKQFGIASNVTYTTYTLW